MRWCLIINLSRNDFKITLAQNDKNVAQNSKNVAQNDKNVAQNDKNVLKIISCQKTSKYVTKLSFKIVPKIHKIYPKGTKSAQNHKMSPKMAKFCPN